MIIVAVLALLSFDTILCVIEVPKMIKSKMVKELVVFSILLAVGTAMAFMEILKIEIPKSVDLVMWIYSPLSEFLESLFK